MTKQEKLRAATQILFDNDPLIDLIVSLSGSLSDKKKTREERVEEAKEAFQPAKNPFLKMMENLQENSPEFNERTQQALDWYVEKFGDTELGELDPLQTYETKRKAILRFPGQLVTFKYDPKTKRKLPFYDLFPLVLTLDVGTESFLGLNFHYLRPRDRAILMGGLYKYQTIREFQPIIHIRYEQMLGSQTLRYFRPCIKRYLYKQMSPNMAIISPHLWDMSLFMPTDKFVSVTQKEPYARQKVWEESRKMIRKYK